MSQAGLFVIGATHHRAPLAVREKLSLSKDGAAALKTEFAAIAELREFAMLSTCNRIWIERASCGSDPGPACRSGAIGSGTSGALARVDAAGDSVEYPDFGAGG